MLFRLAHLSNGVDASLGWDFIPGWSDAQLPSLVRRGLLLQETRFAVDWLSVPGMLVRSLSDAFPTQMHDGALELAESFDSRISEGQVEDNVVKLADRPGGMPFVNDIQGVSSEFTRTSRWPRLERCPSSYTITSFRRRDGAMHIDSISELSK